MHKWTELQVKRNQYEDLIQIGKTDFYYHNSLVNPEEKLIEGTSKRNFSVEKESKQYKDLIQIDKTDFYYHNSYKIDCFCFEISNLCISFRSIIHVFAFVPFLLFRLVTLTAAVSNDWYMTE